MRRLAILLSWAALIAAAIAVLARTPFTSDMSVFLPTTPDPAQQVLVDQLREGVASRLILVGIEGATPAARAAISRAMTASLRREQGLLLVDNGTGGIGGPTQDYVWRHRYVLSDRVTPGRFTESGLHAALDDDLALLASGMEPLVKAGLPRDPTGEALHVGKALAGESDRTMADGVLVAPDHARALILVETAAPGFDLDVQQAVLERIDRSFADAAATTPESEGARLLTSGPGVFGVATRAVMKHDVTLYSSLASCAIILFLALLFRSGLVLALTLVPVASGALTGLAAVALGFGQVHGITLGFGVTLIGEAVDYAIYLFAQTGAEGGAAGTLGRIWPTLRLGALVSICGFATMLFSSFQGFVQLGVLTITGLVTALLVTALVLPSLLPPGFAGTRVTGLAPLLLRAMARAPVLRWALAALTVASLALILWRSGDLWQDDLASMSPLPANLRVVDQQLRHDIGAPDARYIVIATAPGPEALLATEERIGTALQGAAGAHALDGFDSAASYLPSRQTQAARKAAIPPRATLAANLDAAIRGTPFRPDAFGAFLDEAEAARLAPDYGREALDGTALALKTDALMIRHGNAWLGVLPLRNVSDPKAVAAALPEGRLVDLKAESDLLLHRYRGEALTLGLLGSLAIAALLLVQLRSARKSLAVLTPLGIAVVATTALLALGQRQLSIFNLFGLLLVVAVGSNYCLFFQRGGLTGEAGGRTLVSLLVANLCTVTGFGALSLSRLPVLYGIGGTVAIGTALSLIAGAVLARPEPRP